MRDSMADIHLEYTCSDTDARGNTRWYFRRGGQKVRLNPRGVEIGSAEFFDRYNRALAGALKAKPKREGLQEGTFGHMIERYLASPEFNTLAVRTQAARRAVLLDLQAEHGTKPALMSADAVRAGRDKRSATPAAANNRVKVISALYSWAMARKLADSNPAKGIGRLKMGEGFQCWTREQIEQYRDYWPLGTRQRLAMELLYCTAQRRGDVARMGPQHVRGPKMHIQQEKTGTRLVLPIIQELAAAMRATPANGLTFLGFKNGDSFGNQFAIWCDRAGLPKECRAHGLRKARATHMAEAGKSVHEIRAVTGHKTLEEIERYTEAANQERLAERAFGEQSVPSVQSHSKTGTIGNPKPVIDTTEGE
jgi:integrase